MTTQARDLRGFGKSVATAALCNVAAAATAGIAGILIARSLGAALRGEYAAIMAWFGVVLVVGQLGQTAATTYFVARVPERARDYLATSRNLMVASGIVTLSAGIAVAPLLAPDNDTAMWGHRLMFATCLASFVGAGYVFGLQASQLNRWNLVRSVQPIAFLAVVGLLYLFGGLGLMTVMTVLSCTVVAQSALAYLLCRSAGLTGGRADKALARPLGRYGFGQLAASVPTVITGRLDQLVLSFGVAPAVLGNYTVATSLTAMAVPVVAGFGNVAFPRLASRIGSSAGTMLLQRQALLASAAVGMVLLVPVALLAPQLVPAVFGTGFSDAIVLVWLLAPGGVFSACAQVCGDLLRGHGRPFAVARAQWIAAGLTILLLATLVPSLGATGAAIASTVAAGVALLLMLRGLARVTPAGTTSTDAATKPGGAVSIAQGGR